MAKDINYKETKHTDAVHFSAEDSSGSVKWQSDEVVHETSKKKNGSAVNYDAAIKEEQAKKEQEKREKEERERREREEGERNSTRNPAAGLSTAVASAGIAIAEAKEMAKSIDPTTGGNSPYGTVATMGINTKRVNASGVANATNAFVGQQFHETEAYHGKEEVKREIHDVGITDVYNSALRSASRSDVAKKLYGSKSELSQELQDKIKKATGTSFITNVGNKADYIKDSETNLRAIESFLNKEYKIGISVKSDPVSLKLAERKALAKIDANPFLSDEKKIKAKAEITALFKEHKRQNSINIEARKNKKQGGLGKNLIQNAAKQSLGDGDTAQGVKATNTTIKTATAVVKVPGAAVKAGVYTGTFAYNAGVRAKTHAEYKSAKQNLKIQQKALKGGYGNEEFAKNAQRRLDTVRGKRIAAYDKSAEFRAHPYKKIGQGAFKLIDGKSGRITNSRAVQFGKRCVNIVKHKANLLANKFKGTPVGGVLVHIKNVIAQNFLAAKNTTNKFVKNFAKNKFVVAIKKPFSGLNLGKKVLMQALMGAGGVLLLVCIVVMFLGEVIALVPDFSSDDGESHKTVFERNMLELNEKQNNIIQNATDYKHNILYYPERWEFRDWGDPEDLLNQTPLRVEGKQSFGMVTHTFFQGYRMRQYYGPINKIYTADVKKGVWIEGHYETVNLYIPDRIWTNTSHITTTYNSDGEVVSSSAETVDVSATGVTNAGDMSDTSAILSESTNSDGNKIVVEEVITKEFETGHMQPTEVWVAEHWEYHYEPMTITGCGGYNGDLGTFSSQNVVLDSSSSQYQQLIQTQHNNLDVTVEFLREDENGRTPCTMSQFYQTILSMHYGLTENVKDNDAYNRSIFEKLLTTILEQARLTVHTEYAPNSTNVVSWTYIDPESKAETYCSAPGYTPIIKATITIDQCSLQSAIKSTYLSDEFVHIGSTGLYAEQDKTSENYVKFEGWYIYKQHYVGRVPSVPSDVAVKMGLIESIETDNLIYAAQAYMLPEAEFWDLYQSPGLPAQLQAATNVILP